MSAAKLPQSEIDYQLAHPNDISCHGLPAYTIAFLCVVTLALALRLWARSIAKIGWSSDDYTLILGWVLGVGCQVCMLVQISHGGFCRHTLTISKERFAISGKAGYAFDVLYTTSYPISRISLLLLYKRIFIQRWFKLTCWVMIGCYAGYAIGSMTADFLSAMPVNSKWNPDAKPTRQINGPILYQANSIFNIATDTILLILPLVTIWRLKMTPAQKIGISAIFSLGVLTIIASVFRLVAYFRYDKNDPQWGLPSTAWWTTTELCLGLLCPCLVTFRPVLHRGYTYFAAHLPRTLRSRLDKVVGPEASSSTYVSKQSEISRKKSKQSDFGAYGPLGNEVEALTSQPASLKSRDSQLEAGVVPLQDLDRANGPIAQAVTTDHAVHQPPPPPPATHSRGAMPLSDEEALANLDPRMSARNSLGQPQNLGTRTEVGKDYTPQAVPYSGIAISRDYKLESERG